MAAHPAYIANIRLKQKTKKALDINKPHLTHKLSDQSMECADFEVNLEVASLLVEGNSLEWL